MNRKEFFDTVVVTTTTNEVKTVVSTNPIDNPVKCDNMYDFYSRIKFDNNNNLIIKLK